jgi:PAS domain S-box-containing protein
MQTQIFSLKKKYLLPLFTGLTGIILITGGYLYYRNVAKTISNERYDELKAIAELKINQLSQWRKERLANINILSKNPDFIRSTEQLAADINLLSAKKNLTSVSAEYIENYGYENLFITTLKGDLLFSFGPEIKRIDKKTIMLINNIIKNKKIILSDLYPCETHNKIHYDFLAPVINKQNNLIAILILRINPDDYLYPLIQNWPAASKSSETFIVRRDGDSVLFLNELRSQKNKAISLRIALTRKEIPAVQAVLGRKGLFKGKDYSGANVITDLRPVPGTDWFMIAKTDQKEILAEARYKASFVLLIIVALLICLGFIIVLYYLNRQRNSKELLLKEKILLETKEESRTILYSIGDGVITTDTKGYVSQMNLVAERLTGWKETEAKGKKINEVFHIVNEETLSEVENPIRRVLLEGVIVGLANHTLLITKDRKQIPIADSAAPIKNTAGDITGVVLVFRDQTEERAAQKALAESERKFRETLIYLDEGYYSCSKDGIVIEHNLAFNRILGIDINKDMKGSKLPDFWQNPDDRKVYLQELMTTGFIRNFVINAKTISGEKVVVMVNSHLVKDENEKPARIEGTFTDFTRLKQTEEALKESETKYRTLFENAQVGMYRSKIDGSAFLDVNDRFAEIIGFAREELLGTAGSIRWANPEDRDRMLKLLKDQGGFLSNYETRVLAKNGDVRDVLASIALHTGEGIIDGTMVDITERKRLEEVIKNDDKQLRNFSKELEQKVDERTKELQKSKKTLDETSRIARVGGWEIDLKKNELSWTDMVYHIHEIGPEFKPTVEKGINFYAPEAIPVISEAVQHAIADGQSFDVELQIITAKNNKIWVRAIGEAYRENGEILKIGGMFQDINERKLAEIESRKKSEQLQLLSNELEIIIDSIPGLVFYKDTNNRFIRVNKYISEAYKLSKKQLEGINLNDLHSREQAQAYYEDDLQVIRSRQPKINIDEPWETESGIRWVSTSKIPYMDETGEVVGVIGVSMDVTERKLAEEELKKHREHLEELVTERTAELDAAVQNLQHSNQDLEQFAYIASHDLQEPLRMISSFTQLLSKRYTDKLDKEANEFIEFIVDGANRMQRLIQDLLSFSRIITRGGALNIVNSHQALVEAISNLQILIKESGTIITNDDLPQVVADSSQLVQLFQNLLGNSIKFHGEESPRVHILSELKDNEWVFSIKDNGIGIDPMYFERIFVIFQRLNSGNQYPGTGIGLAICNRIVQRHGGKIWVESELGKGSTFHFTLKNKETNHGT